MNADEMREINICNKLNGYGKLELKGLKPQDNNFIYNPDENTKNEWKYALWDAETYKIKEVSTFRIVSHDPPISKLIETQMFI
jgi:hypothetical protein